MGQEQAGMHEQMLAVSKHPCVRVFRNNTGKAYQGKVISNSNGVLILQNPRIIHFGLCVGSSDLVGWKSVVITQDMVGMTIAQFLAIESKAENGKKGDEQKNFIKRVKEAGGISGFAHSAQEAKDIIA